MVVYIFFFLPTLFHARVLKIVPSEFSCYPFWSPDVGSKPAQLVEFERLTDTEGLHGFHFIPIIIVIDVIIIGCQKIKSRLSNIKGLPDEDLSLPPVFINRPLYFVTFSTFLILSPHQKCGFNQLFHSELTLIPVLSYCKRCTVMLWCELILTAGWV